MRTYYRTRDGRVDYGFDILEQGPNDWRVYIKSQPSYQGRAEDADSTHRLSDSRGVYVCWTDPITSETAAKTVAASWAEGTQRYIGTGRFGSETVTGWRR